MNVCCSFVKFLVVLMNLAFWLVGIAIVGLAVWMLLDPAFMISVAQDQQNYQIGVYVLLGLGVLIIILAFCGCCGAFRESRSMLVWFFCCMLIILTAEIAAGVWAYTNSDKLEAFVKSNLKHTINTEYGKIESRTEIIDLIQKNLECCGVDSPADWSYSSYNQAKNGALVDLSIKNQSKPKLNYQLPESCCNSTIEKAVCNNSRKSFLNTTVNRDINRIGCMERIVSVVTSHTEHLLIGCLIVLSVQLFGILLITCLCCAVRRSKDRDLKD